VLVLELSAWSGPKFFVLARRSKTALRLAPKFSSTRLLAPTSFYLRTLSPRQVEHDIRLGNTADQVTGIQIVNHWQTFGTDFREFLKGITHSLETGDPREIFVHEIDRN